MENAAKRGRQALTGLRSIQGRFPGLITDVRGKGLMIGIEFDTADHAEEVQYGCFARGLLVLECGRSTVRMAPPLIVSQAEMATGLKIFDEAVAAVATEHGEVLRAAERAGVMSGIEAAT